MQLTKNFSKKELQCKCGCGRCDIDLELLDALQDLRDRLGFPLLITSGYRCAKYNAKVGGSPNSRHMTGEAVDIAINTKIMNPIKVRALLSEILKDDRLGGIGVANAFIHIDTRKIPEIWAY